jgi:P27 family predicted phage terminase small subunit
MAKGGRRPGAGRKPGSKNKPKPQAKAKTAVPPKPAFTVIEGGDGRIPEPDWSLIFADELDQSIARSEWSAVIRELRDTDKLATVNAHQIKRLVCAYVLYEQATRHVAEEGACFPRKGKKQPAWNPWFTVLKDANAMASAAEAELTITPRRRNNGGKVQKKQATGAGSRYLKPVAR